MTNLLVGVPIEVAPHWRVRGLGGTVTERLDGTAWFQVYKQDPSNTVLQYVQANGTLSNAPHNFPLAVVGLQWYASWTPPSQVQRSNITIQAFHSDAALESIILHNDALVTQTTTDDLVAAGITDKRLVFGPSG